MINKGKGRTMEKWSKEKAWEWYNSRPWIRGFNFVPSDCSGWVEMWQEYNHAEKVETIRRELALAKQIGFNAVRQFLAFDVWMYQRESFLKNVEEFLSIAAENGIGVLFVLISALIRSTFFFSADAMCSTVVFSPMRKKTCFKCLRK